MADETKRMLSVTDLSSYLYCPRKFYLAKVCGIKEPPNKAMISGLIRHHVLEEFSKNEKKIVLEMDPSDKDSIVKKYYSVLGKIVNEIFARNKMKMKTFEISADDMWKAIIQQMKHDILLRTDTILKGLERGYVGEELWENLSPKYISEMPLISKKLGLKGRADRVMISDYKIIPYELKTRASDKVWPSDEVQVTAYAMLLEEKYNTEVPLGVLESGNVKHEIQITREKREKVLELIEKINKMFDEKKAQYPSNFAKCQKCSFEEECEALENED